DVGMTGAYDSIIGFRPDEALHRFLMNTPRKLEGAKRDIRMSGAMIEVDEASGRASRITRIHEKVEEYFADRGSQLAALNCERRPVNREFSVVALGPIHTESIEPLTAHLAHLEQVMTNLPPRVDLTASRAELNRAIDAAAHDWILILREREFID